MSDHDTCNLVPWLQEQIERRDKKLEALEAHAANMTAELNACREESKRLREMRSRAVTFAAKVDSAALMAINHPEVDDDLKSHAHSDRDIAAQIRSILKGDNA